MRKTSITLAFLLAACSSGQTPDVQTGPQGNTAQGKDTPANTEKKDTVDTQLTYADDVEQRLSRFSPTDIDFDEALVNKENRQVLIKLVQVAKILDSIFIDQVSGNNRQIRQRLLEQKAPEAVVTYFDVMYGPWDRLNGDEPFVGQAPKPEGAGFYPEDLTKEELESWIKAHPEQEEAFRGYFTVIARTKDGGLKAVPYAEAYQERLKKAAALMHEAAELTSHPALKRYLKTRGDAFLSNDYYESDMAWMDLGDSPLEVVLGPYEVYEDGLMGYKAAFEAFITLRDPKDSAQLQKLAKYNLELEKNLPLPRKYFTKRGSHSPISVVIQVFTAGDTRAGVQTAAFNLPNDERVRTAKGSKKVMLKNVQEAKFEKALLPIAQTVLAGEYFSRVNFDAYFMDILLHEMAHGMGPGKIKVNGRDTEVNKELKDLYPAIEEAKADIVGLHNGAYLVKKKALPASLAKELPATYVAGVFRAVRFGTEEAHAKAVLLAFNYLQKHGAITYDEDSGRFGVNYKLFDKVVTELAGKLLLVEAQGDYAGAQKLLKEYSELSPEMEKALGRLSDVPVDILPHYTIEEKMKSW